MIASQFQLRTTEHASDRCLQLCFASAAGGAHPRGIHPDTCAKMRQPSCRCAASEALSEVRKRRSRRFPERLSLQPRPRSRMKSRPTARQSRQAPYVHPPTQCRKYAPSIQERMAAGHRNRRACQNRTQSRSGSARASAQPRMDRSLTALNAPARPDYLRSSSATSYRFAAPSYLMLYDAG